MRSSLTVVADSDLASALPTTETVAQRIRRLQAETKILADEHVQSLAAALASIEQLAAEIAAGGDAYRPGVRDLARRIAEEADARAQTLSAIGARTR